MDGPMFTSIEDQDREVLKRQIECLSNGAVIETTNNVSEAGENNICPSVWDSIACWPATPSGMLQTKPCPNYIAGFVEGEASRQCMDNGQWFVSAETNEPWTNYSQCFSNPLATVVVRIPDVANASHFQTWLPMMKRVKQVGNSFSLISLLMAFLILASTKRLRRCPRNTVHMHLFVSFILRASMAFIKDSLFVEGLGLASDVVTKNGLSFFSQQEKNWVCKCVMSIWQFCIMANYSWILMEGLYLHSLIFMAMFTDSSAITLYVIMGWGLPVPAVILWVVLRATLDNNYCWTTHENRALSLPIILPIILSNLINFCLFINIVRVLFLKLRSSICEETRRYRKWGRSTLVLMPLFGIHSTLFLWMNIEQNTRIETLGLFFDQLFTSFQGFFVAVLYCFLNGEVRTELEKKWRKMRWFWFRRLDPQPMFGSHVRSSIELGSGRCGNATRASGAGNGILARRERWSRNSCTSNCTMLESAIRRLEPQNSSLCAQAQVSSALLHQKNSGQVCCSTNPPGAERCERADENITSERLLNQTSDINEEATL